VAAISCTSGRLGKLCLHGWLVACLLAWRNTHQTKEAEVALQARQQGAVGSAFAGPYTLADGSTGTSQAALVTAVCEAAVRVMKG
jgi:hypothetical protein